jgi:hypothetical protein
MPSQLKLLRESRSKGTFDLVDKNLNRRISQSNTRRGYSKSPTDEDTERIVEDYIEDEYLDNITSKKKALDSVKSLEQGNSKKGLKRDFINYIAGVGRDNIADFIYKKYSKNSFSKIESNKIKTKSGLERKGFKVNSEVYLIVITTKKGSKYVQARRFKDNRIVKMLS